jgi:hypothetical protein
MSTALCEELIVGRSHLHWNRKQHYIGLRQFLDSPSDRDRHSAESLRCKPGGGGIGVGDIGNSYAFRSAQHRQMDAAYDLTSTHNSN